MIFSVLLTRKLKKLGENEISEDREKQKQKDFALTSKLHRGNYILDPYSSELDETPEIKLLQVILNTKLIGLVL